MINIIKSEIFKYSRRPYFYIIIFLAFIIALICPFGFRFIIGDFTATEVESSIEMFKMILPIFIPASAIIFACIFSEEYTEKTIKNIIPYNISKKKFFLSKLFVQIILSIVIFLLVLLGFNLSLFLNIKDFSSVSSIIYDFSLLYIACLPICILGIVIIDFLVIILKKDILVYLAYYFIFVQGPFYVRALSLVLPEWFKDIEKYIIFMAIEPVTNPVVLNKDIVFLLWTSVLYSAIFLFIGYNIFVKQEVK